MQSALCLVVCVFCFFFFFNDTATTEIYTLSLHDALPIWKRDRRRRADGSNERQEREPEPDRETRSPHGIFLPQPGEPAPPRTGRLHPKRPAITGCHTAPITSRNRAETRPRLTSKSPYTPGT